MKKSVQTLAFIAVLLLLSGNVSAVNFDWAVVVDAGNLGDSQVMNDGSSGYGSVDKDYRISKYEVTNSQYAEFLTAVAGSSDIHGLYDTRMVITKSGQTYIANTAYANKPVVWVDWFDAIRFTNWLHNGATIGADTESGAYNLTQPNITRSESAVYWLPSEDEWYKAAYFDPLIGNPDESNNYWEYPTRSNIINTSDANYHASGLIDVGSYDKASYYGTYDQAGNVWEWNETWINISETYRGHRGDGWRNDNMNLSSLDRYGNVPAFEADDIGFRIASSALTIPEPFSIVMFMTGICGLIFRKKKIA